MRHNTNADFAARSSLTQEEINFFHTNCGTSGLKALSAISIGKEEKTEAVRRVQFSADDYLPVRKSRQYYETSKEEGDTPSTNVLRYKGRIIQLQPQQVPKGLNHDTMFNHIPAACLETAVSIEVLNNPGAAGTKIDEAAVKLSQILERCYDPANAHLQVQDGKGGSKPLTEVLNKGILHELRPNGTQIGRLLDISNDGSHWLEGEGRDWLLAQLNTAEGGRDCLLTKVRAISAFGKFIYDNMKNNKELMRDLLGKEEEETTVRFTNFLEKVRHADFADSDARLRSERAPIVAINGVPRPITALDPKPAQFLNVPGASSGWTFTDAGFAPNHRHVAEQVKLDLAKYTPEGIPRLNAVITDPTRVGILTDYAAKNMPKAFVDAGLIGLLKDNAMPHGNGINRWTQQGIFIRELLSRDLTNAGSFSGSTADILLALDFLSEETIFGNEKYVSSVGVIIASWMNFGGYHSLPEAYLIAKSVAKNEKFEVLGANSTASRETADSFYGHFMSVVGEETDAQIKPFVDAYHASRS